MKLRTKGKPFNLTKPLLLKATRFKHKLKEPHYCLILENEEVLSSKFNSIISISTAKIISKDYNGTCLYNVKDLSHVSENDILYIGLDGNLRSMYRVNSKQNTLLLTERCNSNCLMCSQPPKDKDDIHFIHDIHLQLIPLIPKDCHDLILTGGEPTLLGDKLFELLELIKIELPSTEIHILTNGRIFAINSIAERIAKINNPRIMLGIPLYSDYYQTHDYVVQTKDAFYQTIMGIHNLKRYNVRVEIRIVLHKATISRLLKLSEFIYRNLTFVDQIVFMGLEVIGFTKTNLSDVWIEPYEYMNDLEKAVSYLHRRKMNVLIYNTPLCLLPQELWSFSRKSISDWKNIYFEECNSCAMIDECGGLFESSTTKYSEHLIAFKEDPRVENSYSSIVQ